MPWTGRSVNLQRDWRYRNAFTSNTDGFGGGRGSALAGEQLYSDARTDQIDLERGGSDRGGLVASEHFWAISLAFAHSNWGVTEPRKRPIVGQLGLEVCD